MILDGVAASEAIDSSGERLSVEGCDISSLPVDGTINYEHLSGDQGKVPPGEETVGRILAAKKIFGASDCKTEREEEYWRKVKLPFIYIVYRLFDGAGHRGAQALAAAIRDAHANDEKILVRLSIEGSTLHREGQILETSVARRVAATWKPCNRTCNIGILSDPNAPPGFDKQPVDRRDVEEALVAKAEPLLPVPDPMYERLGSHEDEGRPLVADGALDLLKGEIRAKILKALEAGGYNVAPSALTGGAALQVEDRGRRKRRALEVLHRYLDERPSFDRTEFRAHAKHELPDADDEFLDRFSDVAQDYHVKRSALGKAIDLEGDRVNRPQPGLGWAEPPKEKKPKAEPAKAPAKGTKKPLAERIAAKAAPAGPGPNPQAAIPGAGGGGKKRLTLHPDGTLQLPSGEKVPLHIPSTSAYMEILHPELHDLSEEKKLLYQHSVHEPWERAMENWMELNKAAREKRTPRSIVKLAGLFAAMSPNTGVRDQERYYGHVMDMLHEGQMDVNEPVAPEHVAEFERRAQGPLPPRWNREHYDANAPAQGVKTWEEAAERASEPNAGGNEKGDLPQIAGLKGIDQILPHLEHLFAQHGDDGRAMAGELMNMKAAYKRKATAAGAQEAKESFQGKHPIVAGFGPKLTRYMLTMAGAGNSLVPDRHMTRSLYNAEAGSPLADYLATRVVTQAKNEPFLRSLDQHFFHKHPAVKHVLSKYPEHFKGHEEQAIFPAFWLHWLAIPHYERNQGRETQATIGGTDHRVFWDSIQDSMRRHGIPVRGRQYDYQAPDTSFDFGANVAKAEDPDHPWAGHAPEVRALGALWELEMKHGSTGALAGYFAHVAPWLTSLEAGRRWRDPNAVVRKFEGLFVDLRKALGEERAAAPAVQPGVPFAGELVQPGRARTAEGDWDLLHEDETHLYGIPAGTPAEDYPERLRKFPKAKHPGSFLVLERPRVNVADLS